ncbi:MAG: tautomerase family protein [Oscillospiraceae bacterium]|nr:tautomerase family protein [Oscillospiraceae bacterium]
MPHISVMMYPGRDEATKEAIAKNLQAELMKTLNAPASVISVSVEDIAPENWNETIGAKVKSEDILIETDYVKKA